MLYSCLFYDALPLEESWQVGRAFVLSFNPSHQNSSWENIASGIYDRVGDTITTVTPRSA